MHLEKPFYLHTSQKWFFDFMTIFRSKVHITRPYPPVFSLERKRRRENHPKHWFAAHKNPKITLSRHHHTLQRKMVECSFANGMEEFDYSG
jgi:hypothetical protein